MVFQRLLATLAFSALVLSAETDYRFAFPQSEFLMGVDLKWLMKSPFGETMRKEMKGNLGELQPLETFLEQIDSIHLSVVSKNAKTSDLLVMVDGRFDLAQLTALAAKSGMRMEQWGKTTVVLPKRTKALPTKKAGFQKVQFNMELPSAKPGFALVDSKHIVIGEEAPLRVALERLETGLTPQANPLFERARDLEAANDIWMIGNTASLNLNAAAGKKADPMTQMASQVRNFSIGVAVRRNVAMELQLQTTSPKVAEQMLDLVKGAVAMAKMNPNPAEPLPVDIDKVLQFSASGNIVRASLSMEQQDIDKLMASKWMPDTVRKKAETANGVGGEKPEVAAVAPVVVAQPVVPAVPARKTVIIYGLPGGPKEVPVN